ncbi:MAG TPA: hypothetical protein VGQ99_09245 [Tepidisphaeraceae bacterium]|nr:hypothetical protein [Tepidisphaeraceae bacterium]
MTVTLPTIRAALVEHHRRYKSRRGWSIEYHVECWQDGIRACESCTLSDYKIVYLHLRNKWRAFRPITPHQWGPERILAELNVCDGDFKSRNLSSIREHDVPALSEMLTRLGQMKKNKRGPSVVALSKVLHFWNPRLFVIVDDLIMWKWVFGHWWLREPVDEIRKRLTAILPIRGKSDDPSCDLSSYVAILLWTSELARKNQALTTEFANYVRKYSKRDVTPIPLEVYEAAAVEWFLLGAVELIPNGIECSKAAVPALL